MSGREIDMLAFSQLASYNLGEWRDKMNQHLVSQPAIFLLLLVKVKFQLSPSPITRIAHILASLSVI